MIMFDILKKIIAIVEKARDNEQAVAGIYLEEEIKSIERYLDDEYMELNTVGRFGEIPIYLIDKINSEVLGELKDYEGTPYSVLQTLTMD